MISKLRYWYYSRKFKSKLKYKLFLESELIKLNLEFQKTNWTYREEATVTVAESAVWREKDDQDLPTKESFGEIGKV